MASRRVNGVMAVIRKLGQMDRQKWEAEAIPFVGMMGHEQRGSKTHLVIKKGLVDLNGKAYAHLQGMRSRLGVDDCYDFYPGVCYFGPAELTEPGPRSLFLEQMKA